MINQLSKDTYSNYSLHTVDYMNTELSNFKCEQINSEFFNSAGC